MGESVKGWFGAVHAAIAPGCGAVTGKRQVEQAVVAASRDIDAVYEQRLVMPSTCSTVLVLSVDGKGIVMRPEALRPATHKAAARGRFRTRLACGEKPARKRMATLACVYDAAPRPAAA
ncbi:hypothetical protein [Nocardiopsis rhodophaea]|uniref:hypothetical protein n=1 Tax=Nocardiopsis rhodophaea TaxID=280238 RepID=UPI0031DEE6A5